MCGHLQLPGTPVGIQRLRVVLECFYDEVSGGLGDQLYLGLHLIRNRERNEVLVGQSHYALQIQNYLV